MIRGRAPRARSRDAELELLITKTLASTPVYATTLEYALDGPRVQVESNRRRAHLARLRALSLHRVETFNLSLDPLFFANVRDFVGLYLQPSDHSLLLRVAENSQIQSLDRRAPVLPMRPGQSCLLSPVFCLLAPSS